MTLAGTRPPTVDEWEQYELHHRSRMSTKPGITGMWQVSGRSDITDFEEELFEGTEQYVSRFIQELDNTVDEVAVKEVMSMIPEAAVSGYTLQDSIKVGIYDELVIDFGSIEL